MKIADTRRRTLLFETRLQRATTLRKSTFAWTCLSRPIRLPAARTRASPSIGSVKAGSETIKDLAWSYKTLFPEIVKIAGPLDVAAPIKHAGIRMHWPNWYEICATVGDMLFLYRNKTPTVFQTAASERLRWLPIPSSRTRRERASAHGCTLVTPSAPGFGKCFSYQAIDRSVQSVWCLTSWRPWPSRG